MSFKRFRTDRMSREEVIETIERFLAGKPKRYGEWDDFISVPLDDENLERIRNIVASLSDRYPAQGRGYCNDEGLKVLRRLVDELRSQTTA